jgi:hypothetical protein
MDMIQERFKRQGRSIDIDREAIAVFAAEHHEKHHGERWNGRQIRNACQTALALAEFEAQGRNHRMVLKPDAIVRLEVEHFKTVQAAYLEFAKYMDDLWGSHAPRRAKEARIRAMWADESDRLGLSPDKKMAFRLASQSSSSWSGGGQANPTTTTQPQPGFAQGFGWQQQAAPAIQPQFFPYSAMGMPQAAFPQSDPMQMHMQIPPGRQPNMDAHPQNPQDLLSRNIQAMYSASNPQGMGQAPPGVAAQMGASPGAAQQWSGDQRPGGQGQSGLPPS